MENSNVTIVSAFMANITAPEYLKTNENYKKFTEHFIPLLRANVNKVIFIDTAVIDKYKSYENHNTKIVPFVKESNYLYDHMDKITNFQLNTNNHEKDTIEFMLTICHKPEWMKQAIHLNHFQTTKFIWIDFGIGHVFKNKCSPEEIVEKINSLQHKHYDNIRIGGIWNINYQFNNDIYKNVAWYFAGGVFGGNGTTLIKFADLMKEKCIDIITKKNTIMWEVNIWYLIWCENRDLFDIYTCDHDNRIIDNY
jgi:hypothetical protein